MSEFQLKSTAAPRTRQQLVAERLRKAILVGYFRPGEKLDQASIADELDVSRSPVREALRTLTAEGLLTSIPHRGVFVAERTAHEIEELHFIRGKLEGAAANRAAEVITDEQLAKIAEILDEADATDDYQKLLRLNHQFHFTIYEAYPQEQLCGMIHEIRNKLAPYIRLYLDGKGHRKRAWDDHREIFEALASRDGDAVEAQIREHIDHICEGILAQMPGEDESRGEVPAKKRTLADVPT